MSDDGWREVKLKDVAKIVAGGTPSTKDESNFSGDIPWITPRDLSSFQGRYISRGGRNITQKGLDSSSAALLPANSVLLSSRAPIGYVVIAANPLTTNQGFKNLILKDGHDPMFFYYLLQSSNEMLQANSSGSTFKELSKSVVENLKFKVPNLKTQKKIASMLSALDDRIEHNNTLARLLEENAQALYQSWFVRFDPVRAKERGEVPRGINPDQPMEKELADLFPDKIDPDTGLPEGWFRTSIKDLESVNIVKPSLSNEIYNELTEPFCYIATRNVNRQFVNGCEMVDLNNRHSRANMQPGDGRIWFAKMHNSRKYLWTMREFNNYWSDKILSTGFAGLSSSNKHLESLLFLIVSSPEFEYLKNSGATGTTMKAVNNSWIEKISIVIPENDILKALDLTIRPMLNLYWYYQLNNMAFINVRDHLLPRLVSGKIDLGAAKEEVEKA